MSFFGDPLIAGHSGWNRFPGLKRYSHTYTGVRGSGHMSRRSIPVTVPPRYPSSYIPIQDDVANKVASYTGTTYTRRRKRTKPRKVCCRYIKGKKVCKPSYCSKNKKYWY